MPVKRTIAAALATVIVLVVGADASAHADRTPRAPVATPMATIEGGLGSGSTIGPDGALYVTDGNGDGTVGRVLRIDRRSGRMTTYASGLPRQVLGIGGAMDIAFLGNTAYVLVTMVGGDLLTPDGPQPFGDAIDGIYRLNRNGTTTVVANIGAFAAANPPTGFGYFITTGVQYAMEPYRGGFLVTDGHHNRVLRVTLDGHVSQFATFGDEVPTGLERSGNTVYVAQAGPVPHLPRSAKIVALTHNSSAPSVVASGRDGDEAGLTVDVERGPRHDLYALLQGVWNLPNIPDNAGMPASHNSGKLVRVTSAGTFTPVVGSLDQPTSLEIVGDTAYVVSLTGAVTRIDHISG
jgi:hypothetical protein